MNYVYLFISVGCLYYMFRADVILDSPIDTQPGTQSGSDKRLLCIRLLLIGVRIPVSDNTEESGY